MRSSFCLVVFPPLNFLSVTNDFFFLLLHKKIEQRDKTQFKKTKYKQIYWDSTDTKSLHQTFSRLALNFRINSQAAGDGQVSRREGYWALGPHSNQLPGGLTQHNRPPFPVRLSFPPTSQTVLKQRKCCAVFRKIAGFHSTEKCF